NAQRPYSSPTRRSSDLDMIPELLNVLDEADPRMPTVKKIGGVKASFVREMVKVNHHRNCMMCHAPGNPGTVGSAIVAEVPIEGRSEEHTSELTSHLNLV